MAGSFLSLLPIQAQATSGTTHSSNTTLSTQSPTQCPAPEVTPGSTTTLSLFWITDTQYISEFNPGLFTNATQWIAKYYAACNGRMVVHTGDVIQDTSSVGGTTCSINDDQGPEWTNDPQWLAANQSMSVLLKANIPYTWNAGNHDGCLTSGLNVLADGWIGWNYAAFNASVVHKASQNWVDAAWVGGWNDGMDTAVSFTGAGQSFLLINIQYNGTAELAWARGLLSSPSYKNYHVIIATHDFINNVGTTDLPNFPTELTCLIDGCNGQKGYPNVFLTLNGHFDIMNQGYHAETAGGQYELMFDREKQEGNNGAATVVILTFDVKNGKIYVNTFDLNNPPSGEDSTPLSSPSYQYQLDESFQLSQSSESTVTSAMCVPSSVPVGSPVKCTALVSGSSPTGTVAWSSSNNVETAGMAGEFSPGTCTLVKKTCSVSYIPTSGSSPVMITARYSGDSHSGPSYGTASLSLNLTPGAIVPSSPTIGIGETIQLRANPLGGVPELTFAGDHANYNVTWYIAAGAGVCSTSDDPVSTVAIYSASPTASTYYCYIATDSEIPPVSVESSTDLVTVGPALSPPTVSVSPATIGTGSSSALMTKTLFIGGAPPYTCQWLEKSPSAANFSNLRGSFKAGCTTSSKPSVSTGALTTSGTWMFELQVTDAARTTVVSSPITLTASILPGSVLAVWCSPASVAVGLGVICKATVRGSEPTLAVAWSSNGLGMFSSTSCILSKGVCSVKYTPASSSSPVTIIAHYSGDLHNLPSAGTFSLAVTMKVSRTVISCSLTSVPSASSKTVTCRATVTGYLPTGTVSWSQSGTGSVSFKSTTCTLAKGACSVTMTGKTAGKVTILGTYSGDPNNRGSSRTAMLVVTKASVA